MPAAAATSGTETVSGTIVFSGVPGTNTRTVTASVVRANGAFRGVSRFAEVVPADPAGVSQDDLVFPQRNHPPGQQAREDPVIFY